MSSNRHINKIVVFCGANPGHDPVFKEQAQTLGRLLAQKGYMLIYGGGNFGLMGVVSQEALAYGGRVKGIIPQVFNKAGEGYTVPEGMEEHIVETIMIRKDRMIHEADAAIAIPGGFGTLDEIFEMIVAQEIRVHQTPDQPIQPMIVVNIGGFFNGIKEQLQACIDAGFIRPGRAALLQFVDSVEEAVAELDRRNAAAPVAAQTFARKPGPAP